MTEGLLQRLIDEDFGLSGRGKWFHSDEHDSLVYDAENDIFFWNSRGIKGNAYNYLILVRGMSKDQAKNFLKNTFGGFRENTNDNTHIVQYDRLKEKFWLNGLDERSYWYKRCLTDDTIDRRELGFYDGWFTVPIYNDKGDFSNIQMRRDEPDKSIYYWYKTGEIYLYNEAILPLCKKIYIVEGLIDCILLNQEGFNSVCAAGANTWKDDWFIKFSKLEEIVYIADNDKPGLRAAKSVARSLGTNRVKIVTFSDKTDKYDSMDFFREYKSSEAFKEYINNNQRYEFQL